MDEKEEILGVRAKEETVNDCESHCQRGSKKESKRVRVAQVKKTM